MSIVAIEINPNRILLVAGRKSPGSSLEASHAIEIPVDASLSDEEIGEKLRDVVNEHGLARNEAIVVPSRSESELREIELPPSPNNELPDMVMFKAKTDFASFDDRWLLDFVSLDDDENQTRKVLASAIAPTVSERIEKILAPTGLKLKRMVLRPFAIMDCLKDKTSDGVARLVVNPGDQFTDIVVAKGNQTVSTRSIRMSANHSADQRNQLLLSEVRRTLASSKRQLGGSPVKSVILLDDEKSNKHLVGNLNERLNIEVEVVNPLDGVRRTGQIKGDVESPWQYTPLLGTLMDTDNEHGPAIDFLNPSRKVEVVVDHSRWWIYGSLAGLAALLTIGFAWMTLRSQAAEIAQLDVDLADAIKLNDEQGIDEILGRTAEIDKWQKTNINWLDELDELSDLFLTADEVMVSKFDAAVRRNKPQLNLSGKIVSVDEDRKLFRSLEGRPYTVTPNKSNVVKGDKDYPYAFGKLLAIEREDNSWLRELDKHVGEFHKQNNNRANVSADSEEANVDDSIEGSVN